jgi:TctA family transporter
MIETGITILFLLFWMLILALAIGGFVFWILMLVDAAQRDFKKEDEKIVWILVIVLAGWIGALVYFFAGRK